MNKGIVLIALGNTHYLGMAANLAASIRYTDKSVNIHLIHSDESHCWGGRWLPHLTEEHKKLFTSFALCPSECYTKNERTVYLKAKTCIYDLSPFDETILIDVDMVWFSEREISKLFDELKSVEFTMQNRGHCDLSVAKLDPNFSMWCNINEVRERYAADGRFYQLASEFIYFKRTTENKEYFDYVKEIFDNPKVNTTIHANGRKVADNFGGDIPDELAFDIASAVLKKYPHKENFVPVYWFAADKKADKNQLPKNYYGYSIGGNSLTAPVLQKYTGLCWYYAKALGLPFHYNVDSKRQWLPERRKI
jgi:hypothetical protein